MWKLLLTTPQCIEVMNFVIIVAEVKGVDLGVPVWPFAGRTPLWFQNKYGSWPDHVDWPLLIQRNLLSLLLFAGRQNDPKIRLCAPRSGGACEGQQANTVTIWSGLSRLERGFWEGINGGNCHLDPFSRRDGDSFLW